MATTDPASPVTPEQRPAAVPGTFLLGRVLGFEILIHWSWLIIFFLLAWTLEANYLPEVYPAWSSRLRWTVGFVVSTLFFTSILLHELAHSVVARRRGYEVRSITLFIFGGVSGLSNEPRAARDEFWIAIVGPLTSFAIAAVCGLIWLGGRAADLRLVYPIAGYLGYINLTLGIFNLIPGFPLDGGRVLRSLLWGAKGNMLHATRLASVVGRVVAGLIVGTGIVIITAGNLLNGVWFIFIGWFLWNAAESSYQQLLLQTSLHGLTLDSLIERDVPRVPPDLTLRALANEHVLGRYQRVFFVAATPDADILGLVSLSDLAKVPESEWERTTVYRAMTARERLVAASPKTDALAALQLMAEHNINQLPVFDGRNLIGLLTRAGLIQAIQLRARMGNPSLNRSLNSVDSDQGR